MFWFYRVEKREEPYHHYYQQVKLFTYPVKTRYISFVQLSMVPKLFIQITSRDPLTFFSSTTI